MLMKYECSAYVKLITFDGEVLTSNCQVVHMKMPVVTCEPWRLNINQLA